MARRILFLGIGVAVLGLAAYFFQMRLRSQNAAPSAIQSQTTPAPPPYVTPRVNTPTIAILVDRTRLVTERIPSDISARISHVDDAHDLEVLAGVLADAEDDPTVRNEVANLLARSNYPRFGEVLLRVLDKPRESSRFRVFAVQNLGEILIAPAPTTISYESTPNLKTAIASRLRALLSTADVPTQREALWALVRVRDPLAVQTALTWLSAPAPAVEENDLRDLAIRCAQELNLREQIERIRVLARDHNDTVRIAALVALSDWGDQQSRPEFQHAANSSDARLKRCGTLALQKLDGMPPKSP